MTLPKPKSLYQSEMFCISLTCAFRPNHPMVQLAEQIPWELFENRFEELYCPDNGRLGLSSQMMVGLGLKHARGFSDEKVVEWWLDSPPAQYFYEERHFHQESQMNSNRLSRFRSHIGKSECELNLQLIVIAGLGTVALKRSGLKSVPVDTTLQEKCSDISDGCNVELHRVRYAHHLEEDQDFLLRFVAAVNYLLRVGKSNVVSRLPKLPFLCLKIT